MISFSSSFFLVFALSNSNVFKINSRYRKTPSISPRLTQSHNRFLVSLTRREGCINGIIFVSGVYHTCYLYLKKEEWNKTKKNDSLAAKCGFTT